MYASPDDFQIFAKAATDDPDLMRLITLSKVVLTFVCRGIIQAPHCHGWISQLCHALDSLLLQNPTDDTAPAQCIDHTLIADLADISIDKGVQNLLSADGSGTPLVTIDADDPTVNPVYLDASVHSVE